VARESKVATFEVFSTHFMVWMIGQQQVLPFTVILIEAAPGQNLVPEVSQYD
jgi:hypothetical protein